MELIDKESLFNALAKQRAYEPKHRRTIMRSIQLVSEQPTVDAVPVVHGHWIYDAGDMRCVCSECHNHSFQIVRSTEFKPFAEQNKFCFNCGAKMDEVIQNDR